MADIKQADLSKEIEKKYKILNNALVSTPKDDWRDRIEVEIGDTKQPDVFYPQVKIKRWDNEVNASFRLVDDEPKQLTTEGEKIKLIGSKKEVHLYDIAPCEEHPEGGYEFEVILKEKLLTNKIEFTLQTKGLDFFYQPELTQEEKDNGDIRPENIVGSYAVYTSENKINWVGGKLYKAGKVGHIQRPKIIDSNGNWVWGTLEIDKLYGILLVTIPQDFLDKAVYPIRHSSGLTFGYSTVPTGGTVSHDTKAGKAFLSKVAPANNGTPVSISFYTKKWIEGKRMKGALWNSSGGAFIVAADPEEVDNVSEDWVTSTFSSPENIYSSITYYIGAILEYGFFARYDSGDSTGGQHFNNWNSPITIGTVYNSTQKSGVYCTYIPNELRKSLSDSQTIVDYSTSDVYEPTIDTSTNSWATGWSKDRHVFYTSDDLVIVTYQDGMGIKARLSLNGGKSWTNLAGAAGETTITEDTGYEWSGCLDYGNNVHLTFADSSDNIKYVKLTRSSNTWSVGTVYNIVSGTGALPSITYVGSKIWVVWVDTDIDSYKHINVSSSTDGETWAEAVTVSSVENTNVKYPIIVHNNVNPMTIYGDETTNKLYSSLYSGSSWPTPSEVYDGTYNLDARGISAATDATGNINLVWLENDITTWRDRVVYKKYTDSWQTSEIVVSQCLSGNTPVVPIFPIYFPVISIAGGNKIFVVATYYSGVTDQFEIIVQNKNTETGIWDANEGYFLTEQDRKNVYPNAAINGNKFIPFVTVRGTGSPYDIEFYLIHSGGIDQANFLDQPALAYATKLNGQAGNASRVAFIFKAENSKTINKIHFRNYDITGNPATSTLELRSITDLDDKRPTSTVLTSGTFTPVSGWNVVDIADYAVTAGTYYAIVIVPGEVDASNYFRIESAQPQHIIATRFLFVSVGEDDPDDFRGTVDSEPIFLLEFSDSSYEGYPYRPGAGYYEVSIQGLEQIRQKWTQSGNRDIDGFGLYVYGRSSATSLDDLYFDLLKDDISIESGKIVALDKVDLYPSSSTASKVWYTVIFGSPRTLVDSSEYKLILKSPGSNSSNKWWVNLIRTTGSPYKENSWGGVASLLGASANGGSTWTDYDIYDISLRFIYTDEEKGLDPIDSQTISESLVNKLTKVLADSQTITEDIVLDHVTGGGLSQPLSDSITLVETLANEIHKPLSDAHSVSEALQLTVGKSAADSVAFAEEQARVIYLSLADSQSLAESVANISTLSVSDDQSFAESLEITNIFLRSPSDAMSVAEAKAETISKAITDAQDIAEGFVSESATTLSDAQVLAEEALIIGEFSRGYTEAIDISEAETETVTKGPTDSISISETLLVVVSKGLATGLLITEGEATDVGVALPDSLSIAESLANTHTLRLSDSVSFAESLARAWAALRTVADSIDIAESFSSELGRELADSQSIAEAITSISFCLSLSDPLAIAESLTGGILWERDLSDSLIITEVSSIGIERPFRDYLAGAPKMLTGSYTGDGDTDRAITGLGIQPNLVVIRGNNGFSAAWRTADFPDGESNILGTTVAASATAIKSFSADGFRVGDDTNANTLGETYFYIVFSSVPWDSLKVGTYEGNGVDDREIAGVGFQPETVIVSVGDSASKRSRIYSEEATTNKERYLVGEP